MTFDRHIGGSAADVAVKLSAIKQYSNHKCCGIETRYIGIRRRLLGYWNRTLPEKAILSHEYSNHEFGDTFEYKERISWYGNCYYVDKTFVKPFSNENFLQLRWAAHLNSYIKHFLLMKMWFVYWNKSNKRGSLHIVQQRTPSGWRNVMKYNIRHFLIITLVVTQFDKLPPTHSIRFRSTC